MPAKAAMPTFTLALLPTTKTNTATITTTAPNLPATPSLPTTNTDTNSFWAC